MTEDCKHDCNWDMNCKREGNVHMCVVHARTEDLVDYDEVKQKRLADLDELYQVFPANTVTGTNLRIWIAQKRKEIETT